MMFFFLVPKLRLGTGFRETPFRLQFTMQAWRQQGTIVQSRSPVCTMLCYRNPANICDFALPKGTIVHSIH